MFEEAVERFHQLDDCYVWAVVDKLMISVGSVGPTPCVGEGVELRLAHLPARLAKEDVVIRVRVKRRIEINKIDTRIGKFLPIRKPFQIVAEIQAVHSVEMFIARSAVAPLASRGAQQRACLFAAYKRLRGSSAYVYNARRVL